MCEATSRELSPVDQRQEELRSFLLAVSELYSAKLFRQLVLVFAASTGLPLRDVGRLRVDELRSIEFQSRAQSFADYCQRASGVSLNRCVTAFLAATHKKSEDDALVFSLRRKAGQTASAQSLEKILREGWYRCNTSTRFTYAEIQALADFAVSNVGDDQFAEEVLVGSRDELFQKTLDCVVGYLHRFFPDPVDREEARQETAVQLLEYEKTKECRIAPAIHWRLARRILQRLRSHWQKRPGALREITMSEAVKWAVSPLKKAREVSVADKEALLALKAALDGLTYWEKSFLTQYFGLEGCEVKSLDTIAAKSNRTRSDVRAQMKRGLAHLRRHFALLTSGKRP